MKDECHGGDYTLAVIIGLICLLSICSSLGKIEKRLDALEARPAAESPAAK